jgi:hypothetical protein
LLPSLQALFCSRTTWSLAPQCCRWNDMCCPSHHQPGRPLADSPHHTFSKPPFQALCCSRTT